MNMIESQHLIGGLIVAAAFAAYTPRTTSAENIPLNDLRTPSAPGFVILGMEPTSVERPMTPRAFAVSLASAASNPEALPRDYAIEGSPYWLMPHDDLTYDDYYSNDPLRNVYRNLSLSIAVSKDEALADSLAIDTRIGVGVRTLLFRGRDDPKFLENLNVMQMKILNASTEAEEDSTAAEIKELIQNKDNQPFGFSLEIAGAVGFHVPENDTEKGKAYKGGIWVTPTYRPTSNGQIQFLGVFRSLVEDGVRPRFDVGFRLLWFATDRIAISAEHVSRIGDIPGTDQQDTYRIAGIVDYRLSEDLYLTATFGRNFENPAGGGDLLARLGVDFGFGDKPSVKTPSGGNI